MLFIVMVLFTIQDVTKWLNRSVLEVLAVILAINQVFLFFHFTLMIYYFYQMGVRYVTILQVDDQNGSGVSLRKSKVLFVTISVILFLTSVSLFLVLGFFFINNTFGLGEIDDDSRAFIVF